MNYIYESSRLTRRVFSKPGPIFDLRLSFGRALRKCVNKSAWSQRRVRRQGGSTPIVRPLSGSTGKAL